LAARLLFFMQLAVAYDVAFKRERPLIWLRICLMPDHIIIRYFVLQHFLSPLANACRVLGLFCRWLPVDNMSVWPRAA
jgi:hypothetical protein